MSEITENENPKSNHNYPQLRPVDDSELSGVDRSKDKAGVEYFKLPRWVLDRLVGQKVPWTALPVLMALYETWLRKFDHTSLAHNRVSLTNVMLKKYGVSRGQKNRALKFLAAKKVVSVERWAGRSPDVWLLWYLYGK